MKTNFTTRNGSQRSLRFRVPVAGGRRLPVILVCDLSISMSELGKIDSVNYSMSSSVRHIKKTVQGVEGVEPLLMVIGFGARAEVLLGPEPLDTVSWQNLVADQPNTLVAPGIERLTVELDRMLDGKQGHKPVVVLISDGLAYDRSEAKKAIDGFLASKWGRRAIRVGVGISGAGGDCDLDVLKRFMNNPEREPLVANDAAQLGDYIDWTIRDSFNESMRNGGSADPPQYPDLPSLLVDDEDDDDQDDA